jgi:IS30 family transposase
MGYTHFTNFYRLEISILLNKGHSLRDIARQLKKNPSSISREIKNNSVKGIYDPAKAQHKVWIKRAKSKYQGMKIRNDQELESYVREKLSRHWSPEEISNRIKNHDQHITYVSPPIIYKYVYSVYGQAYSRFLFRKRYRRRKKSGAKQAREIIKNRVFIDQRPQYINEQKRYGHWEGDVLGTIKSDKARVVGLVERKSKFFLAGKIPRLKYAVDGFDQLSSPYHQLFHSITLDNGPENARHEELAARTFFCFPYRSWEKPLIENTFMRLRRFIPKKSSINNYSDEDIRRFVEIMNDTPRKCLNYRTPREVFEKQLLKAGVALDY